VDSKLIYSAVMNQQLWDQTISPFELPVNVNIVMGDVCGGSSSTSMVRIPQVRVLLYGSTREGRVFKPPSVSET
jgi:hypothetical protein